MDKADANILLVEISASPLAFELHQLLCDSQAQFIGIKERLESQIDPVQFTRLYSDIASACIHETVGAASWADSRASSRIEKHGCYPRARIDYLNCIFVFTSNGNNNAGYIKNLMAVNRPTGTTGTRCIQIDYKLDGNNGIERATLIVPSDSGAPLAQTELYPLFNPTVAIS